MSYQTAATKRVIQYRSDLRYQRLEHEGHKLQRHKHSRKLNQRVKHHGTLVRGVNELQQSLLQDSSLRSGVGQREELWKSRIVTVMTSSSFDLERDGKDRSLWGIFLANVHLSVREEHLWREQYSLIHVKHRFHVTWMRQQSCV